MHGWSPPPGQAANGNGLHLPLGAGHVSPGLAFPLVALQGAAVIAAVLGAQGALAEGMLTGWRRWIGGVAALAGVVSAVAGLGWFVVAGNEKLSDHLADGVPAYMVDTGTTDPGHGVLVIRGRVSTGLSYTVLRGDGTTLGEDEILALAPEDHDFSGLVQQFVSQPTSQVVAGLADRGVRYVVQPPPADQSVSARIDSDGDLTRASAASAATRAWKLNTDAPAPAMSGHRSWLRIGLLVIQMVALLVVLVLCLPTIERRRSR